MESGLVARHPNAAMTFELEFALEPAAGGTDFTSSVRFEPHGPLRLLGPLLAIQMRRTSNRLTDRMVALVEAAARPGDAAASSAASA